MGNFLEKDGGNKYIYFIAAIAVVAIFGYLLKYTSDVAGATLALGPVVGGVTSSQAKVFAKADQVASIAIRYGTDPNMQSYQDSTTVTVGSATDFTSIFTLSGLTPGTQYYLNVLVNGAPQFSSSPLPTFKTFPASGVPQPFKFVVLTDFINQRNATQAFPTFLNASNEGAAFAFIGGDFDHRNPGSLGAKRNMFKDLYNPNSIGLADFVNGILKKLPIVHQWDDHDAGADNVDKTYSGWNLSHQAFKEYVPTYNLPADSGIWQKFSYAHVDFFVLDNRSQRDRNGDTDNTSKSMLDGNNRGPSGQLEWFKQGLLSSTAKWKVVFTSVVTNPNTKPTDAWGAFQTEWNSLRAFITANNITGVVFISGDLHSGGIDNGTAAGFPEMVVPNANMVGGTGNCTTGGNQNGIWSEGAYNPKGSCPGYGVVTVLTNPDRLLLEVKDKDGQVKVSYMINM